ncbi:hypothetical protein [Streptomyces sp. TRM68367]|uniref:hypothetical protein n=1 Tax=Streptomyces sp. TRM68367 TaxID=2758415 RepID=UPI00165A5035|nr:hypothetical protein [Streptomyces sp. TRM68367]MBC9723680.1 hypothetical protein [Streptomyces sp. TRM68367]
MEDAAHRAVVETPASLNPTREDSERHVLGIRFWWARDWGLWTYRAGNELFGAALTLALTTTVLGGFAGVSLTAGLADESFLSAAVPDDGRGALLVGGIGFGGVTGLLVPLILYEFVRGTPEKPRLRPGEAALKMLAVLFFGVYVLITALVVAQLRWLLPENLTLLVSVFAVGFSWFPLALLPWERFRLVNAVTGVAIADRGFGFRHD